jgi:hypothetical protein
VGGILISLTTLAVNIFLVQNKAVIDEAMNGYFVNHISVGRILYVFPNRMMFRDVVIGASTTSSGRPAFVLPRITVRFSLWKLLTRRLITISGVNVYPSEISYYALSRFLEDNFQKILEIIRNSPGDDIKIHVGETLVDLARQGDPNYVAMELRMLIRGDVMETTGFFRTGQYRYTVEGGGLRRTAKGRPLWYKLKAQLKPDGLEVDRLIFKDEGLYAKLWGNARGGSLKVNGFAFLRAAQPGIEEDGSAARYFRDFPEDEKMADVEGYILDIDGRAKLAFPDVDVEKLDFTLNNIPVAIQGRVSFLDPVTLAARLTFRHPSPGKAEDTFFEKAEADLSGVWQDNVFNAVGKMDIGFIKHPGLSLSPEKARVVFKGLSFYFDEYKRPSLRLSGGDIAYWTNRNEHKISLRNLKVAANTKMAGLKVIEMDAPFYDGSLSGRMWVDSTQTPVKITSQIILTDVDTGALEDLLIHFAKFDGRMSSKMNFTNVPQLDLSGEITMYDGRLTDFNFFNWVADSFRLPALRAIGFGRASAQFTVNKEHAQLRDIHLKTQDVDIGGYFQVDHQNLVSSKLNLDLSQELLSESNKFKPILRIFKEGPSRLRFDFQLSGNMDAMNFQWLPSPVKRKIQQQIPDFVERMIERNIDEIIGAGPVNQNEK